MTNPTISPQQVRRNMVQWINENKQTFESQTLLAFATKDRDLDSWLSNIDSNSTPGDEFCPVCLMPDVHQTRPNCHQ